jgi:two-component system chemotaxis response regulator CheB
MGADGANGLLNMKRRGAYTIGQDKSTSVVYGMPRAAFEMGAVDIQLPLAEIAEEILAHAE